MRMSPSATGARSSSPARCPPSGSTSCSTRVEKLQQAVKFAREEANNIEAEEPKVGERFFNYLFG